MMRLAACFLFLLHSTNAAGTAPTDICTVALCLQDDGTYCDSTKVYCPQYRLNNEDGVLCRNTPSFGAKFCLWMPPTGPPRTLRPSPTEQPVTTPLRTPSPTPRQTPKVVSTTTTNKPTTTAQATTTATPPTTTAVTPSPTTTKVVTTVTPTTTSFLPTTTVKPESIAATTATPASAAESTAASEGGTKWGIYLGLGAGGLVILTAAAVCLMRRQDPADDSDDEASYAKHESSKHAYPDTLSHIQNETQNGVRNTSGRLSHSSVEF
ncbi:Aste57867_716 [Aphanomyces stellatus]|uniref:Aste57867_716 protein n=1 Tax=Aphanomyces stellatus TaxID=120398 RepID=A0A485K4C1_9STRA|nr:hypothetical protein As57867_000715 [Aphanomyces stellatus]VFT77940.1 Aste57867_716 [Aphanomyces stellatus]